MTTMRERLARAACFSECSNCSGPGQCDGKSDDYRHYVDAILAELQEPTEGMVEACIQEATKQHVAFDEFSPPLFFKPIIAAMIQHIRDGEEPT